jgi:predicted enzyme related to lactoylglutathione lyase
VEIGTVIIKATNTILYCDKWIETVDFYESILQFPITHRNQWFVEFEIGPSYLSIAAAKHATISSVAGQGITLAWQVDNIRETQRKLAEYNVPTTPIVQRMGANVIYIKDPEGHRIELWQPLDE